MIEIHAIYGSDFNDTFSFSAIKVYGGMSNKTSYPLCYRWYYFKLLRHVTHVFVNSLFHVLSLYDTSQSKPIPKFAVLVFCISLAVKTKSTTLKFLLCFRWQTKSNEVLPWWQNETWRLEESSIGLFWWQYDLWRCVWIRERRNCIQTLICLHRKPRMWLTFSLWSSFFIANSFP